MEKILFAPHAIEDKVLELAEKMNSLYPNEPKAPSLYERSSKYV